MGMLTYFAKFANFAKLVCLSFLPIRDVHLWLLVISFTRAQLGLVRQTFKFILVGKLLNK